MIDALIQAGGTTGTTLTSNGASDLWAAAWKGHAAVIKLLLRTAGGRAVLEQPRSNTEYDWLPGPGTTPLGVAELEGHTEAAAVLRAAGAGMA